MMKSEFLDASKSVNASNLATGEDHEMLNAEVPDASSSSVPFELYKTQTTILVSREKFLNVACDALSAYKYFGPNQKADLLLACRYFPVSTSLNPYELEAIKQTYFVVYYLVHLLVFYLHNKTCLKFIVKVE